MTDSHIQRGSPDDQFINIHDIDELRHWSRLLHTTVDGLKEAVIKGDSSASSVRRYLQKYRPSIAAPLLGAASDDR